MKGYITVSEAARRWGVSPRYIQSQIKAGEIKVTRLHDRMFLIKETDFEKIERRPRGRPRKSPGKKKNRSGA